MNPAVVEDLVVLKGASLFTRAVGRGPDVVVLHGGPGADHRSLLPYFDGLARGRTLRYYDQRGCGRSCRPPSSELGWRYHVEDLRQLLERWDLGQVTLSGHSWGCLLAILFAVEYPDRVGQLALVAPAPATSEQRDRYRKRFAARLASEEVATQREGLERSGLRTTDFVAYRKRAFELSLLPYFFEPANAHHTAPFLVSSSVREAVWRSLGTYDVLARLGGVRVPSLVIHGLHDPIPIESSKQIAAALGAPLEVFERSGHLPFVEEHSRFIEVLDAFLPRDFA